MKRKEEVNREMFSEVRLGCLLIWRPFFLVEIRRNSLSNPRFVLPCELPFTPTQSEERHRASGRKSYWPRSQAIQEIMAEPPTHTQGHEQMSPRKVFPAHILDQNPRETKMSPQPGKFHQDSKPSFCIEEGKCRAPRRKAHTHLHRKGIYFHHPVSGMWEKEVDSDGNHLSIQGEECAAQSWWKGGGGGGVLKNPQCTPIIPIFRKSQCV